MEGKGNTLLWVLMSVMVVVFGAFIMQLRETINRSNESIRDMEATMMGEVNELKNKINKDYKKRIEALEKAVTNDLPQLKKKIESSSSAKVAENLDKTIDATNRAIETLTSRQNLEFKTVNDAIARGQEAMDKLSEEVKLGPLPYSDCEAVLSHGNLRNGIYKMSDPTGVEERGLDVYCDMTYNYGGGGWVVIQRRRDHAVTFDRSWRDFREGFGDPTADFWLGNKYLHALTTKHSYELRMDLWDNKGEHKHATYIDLKVASEEDDYRITFGQYSGTAGDSFSVHYDVPFSTFDRDNDKFADGNCADLWKSGWWFTDCYLASLNGMPGMSGWNGIKWEKFHWKDDPAIVKVEIKIRKMKV